MMFQYQNLETQLNFIYLLKKKPLQQFFLLATTKHILVLYSNRTHTFSILVLETHYPNQVYCNFIKKQKDRW